MERLLVGWVCWVVVAWIRWCWFGWVDELVVQLFGGCVGWWVGRWIGGPLLCLC